MITFADHKLTWTLVFLIPLVWLMRWGWGRVGDRLRQFGVAGKLSRSSMRRRTRLERVATVLVVASMVIALAGPRAGFDEVEVQSTGADIFVALDLSNSMLADDVRPSRFERARREVFDLLEHVGEYGRADRIGLVGFAGVSFVQCPLTADTAALKEYLLLMTPGDMPVQGTDIGGAIRTALEAMDAGGAGAGVASARAIVVISDGEDLEGESDAAVKAAVERGVRVFTVGVGTAEGAAVPDVRSGGLKKDARGNVVISRFNGQSLERIAAKTGGNYVELGSPGSTVKNLDFVAVLGETVHESGKMKLWHEKFQLPLGVGVVVLAWLTWSALAGAGSTASVMVFFLAGILAAAVTFGGGAAQAAKSPDHRKIKEIYNQGIDAYEAGDYARARALFDQAAKVGDGEVSARSLYNQGNAAVGANDLDGAEKAYEEALKRTPDDRQAAENLAWVREQKKKQQQNQQQNQGQQDQQQQDQQANQDQQQQQGQQQKQDQQRQDQGKSSSQPEQATNGGQDKQKNSPSEADGKKDQQQQSAGEPKELSPEQARQMLKSVDDLKSKYLYFMLPKDQQEKAQNPPEKDW
ncbi:MAG: hypothetical protein RIQ81_465 [Pseudomonadota bacterium]